MNTLFFQLGERYLTIFPDTQAHLNGHAIITYTYSIYKSTKNSDPLILEHRKSTQLLAENSDPDYYGQITFELPDKLFNYSAGAVSKLGEDEVEQVIEFLSDVRSNPAMWVNLES